MNWRALATTVELMLVSAVGSFFGFLSQSGSGRFTADSLKAAGIAAGTGLVYRLGAVLQNYAGTSPAVVAPAPAPAKTATEATSPPTTPQ